MKLDTSGAVYSAKHPTESLSWHDLSPFTQGYVEAMPWEALTEERIAKRLPLRRAAFRDLAPETLARIIADCSDFEKTPAFAALCAKMVLHDREMMNAGAEFYHVRSGREDYCHGFKANDWPQFTAEPLNVAARAFPPLTVQLGDDGKVSVSA